MHMKLAGGILRYEFPVWTRTVCAENQFSLDSLKSSNKISTKINKLIKD